MSRNAGCAAERLSKVTVVVSAAIAVGVTQYLTSDSVRTVLAYGLIAFVVAMLGARLKSGAATAVVLLTCYLAPAALTLAFGPPYVYVAPYFTIWLSAMLGLIAGTSDLTRWRLGNSLRISLGLWALIIAVSWPIVALREFDFAPVAIMPWSVGNTGIGISPNLVATFVANGAATQLVSLLCIDWIVGRYADRRDQSFLQEVILWLAVGCLLSIVVALYQAVVDIGFLNSAAFSTVGRASGTLRDANPYGVLAALWGPAAVALVMAFGKMSWIGAVLVVSWCGLWVSGSRNALALSLVGLGVSLWYLWPTLSRRSRFSLVLSCGVMIIVSVGFVMLIRTNVTSPVVRFAQAFPLATLTADGMFGLMTRGWDRYGYAAAAGRMIHDFPWFGVGEGTFSFLVVDYGRAAGYRLTVDNAQNWFRHQFAEFGAVGSLGWIGWTLVFACLIATGRPSDRSKSSMTGIVRWLPIMFTLVSLAGMPTMSAPAAITFSVFAAWYLLLIDSSRLDRGLRPILDHSYVWLGVWLLVAIFSAGTVYSARHGLRVPSRAAEFDWPYSYGFYEPESGPDGEYRWVGRRGVIVLEAPKPWMKLTISLDPADGDARLESLLRNAVLRKPLEVRVWRDGEEVLTTALHSTKPVTEYVRIPAGRKRIVIETHVDRVVRPADFGLTESRELGVSVAWNFVDSPR